MQGKYSNHIKKIIEDRQASIEAEAQRFVEANGTALSKGWVEVKDVGDITASEIALEICTDPNFEKQDIPGDYREPGYVKVRYVEKVHTQADR